MATMHVTIPEDIPFECALKDEFAVWDELSNEALFLMERTLHNNLCKT
jgi:hypothetical protein